MLVGWEIFWDESAACQEKRGAYKYPERRLKEKEQWEKREECQGWVDQDFRRCGRDTEYGVSAFAGLWVQQLT